MASIAHPPKRRLPGPPRPEEGAHAAGDPRRRARALRRARLRGDDGGPDRRPRRGVEGDLLPLLRVQGRGDLHQRGVPARAARRQRSRVGPPPRTTSSRPPVRYATSGSPPSTPAASSGRPAPPRPLPLLRGLSFDLALQWQDIIGEALARRHGLAAPDPRCRLVANLVFVALSNAVNRWVQSGFRGEFGPLLDEAFALLTEVCREVERRGRPARRTLSWRWMTTVRRRRRPQCERRRRNRERRAHVAIRSCRARAPRRRARSLPGTPGRPGRHPRPRPAQESN